MKAKKVKRIISAAFLTLVMSLSALTVFAVINEQWWQTAEGHFTLKYESVVSWSHTSETTSTSPSVLSDSQWNYAVPSGNGSVTAKRSVISESSPAMSIGYMSCSYNGTSVFSNKNIISQMTNSLGTVRVISYYGTLDRTTGDLP